MYASAMRACARGGAPQNALALFELIEGEEQHSVRDALARAHADVGNAKASTQILVQMMGEDAAVSSATYDAAFKACAVQESWKHALRLLRRMDKGGVPVSEAGLEAALAPFAVHGRWEDALMVFQRFGERPPLDAQKK